MPKKVSVLRAAELAPGECRAVLVEGQELALFNVDGKFYALSNVCAHVGGPLGEGTLQGTTVTCPWHAWQFDVTNGRCLDRNKEVPCFPTAVENDWVVVTLP
jgi:nitrite reductase/ring-hydroxylating ferredoxin subunit